MLLRGPSGVGKSDLALQALQTGWSLVADDRVTAWASGGRLFGRAPAPLFGLVEARGQAVVRVQARSFASIDLVADLLDGSAEMERLPAARCVRLAGVAVPHSRFRAGEASAMARLALALQANRSPAAKAQL